MSGPFSVYYLRKYFFSAAKSLCNKLFIFSFCLLNFLSKVLIILFIHLLEQYQSFYLFIYFNHINNFIYSFISKMSVILFIQLLKRYQSFHFSIYFNDIHHFIYSFTSTISIVLFTHLFQTYQSFYLFIFFKYNHFIQFAKLYRLLHIIKMYHYIIIYCI